MSDPLTIRVSPVEGGVDAERFAALVAGAILARIRPTDNEATLHISGRSVSVTANGSTQPLFQPLLGVHRVQWMSAGNAKRGTATAARHTTTVSVWCDRTEAVSAPTTLDRDDMRFETYRGSGKGGQHRNKTDSAVRLTHIPTGIVICCESDRSQHRNRETAERELADQLQGVARSKTAAGRVADHEDRRNASTVWTWSWNQQRSEVTDRTGRRVTWRNAERGRF